MAEIAGQSEKAQAEKVQAEKHTGRKILIGTVVSNKMQKTIVVEVTRKKAHPMYKRVISIRKKFYAHDEKNETHPGDVVKIEESRPLSKLKRWTLRKLCGRRRWCRKWTSMPVRVSGASCWLS